jgi:heme-degrading monooxygenase HmoA
MFARVSTYKSGPDTTSDAPADDVMKKVQEIPGYKGMYFLNSKEAGKALSITLWETEEAMVSSREAANKIRTEMSSADKREILDVEEYEVTADSLKG